MISFIIIAIMILVLAICAVALLGVGIVGLFFAGGDILFGVGILYLLFFRKRNKKNKEAKKSE